MIGISQGNVGIEGSFFKILILPDSQRGPIDPIIRLDAEIYRNGGNQIVPWVEEPVCD